MGFKLSCHQGVNKITEVLRESFWAAGPSPNGKLKRKNQPLEKILTADC